uniref:Uncharacterized protein n=1 Tax=Opuntia streptacantha TaxID=393608 RepID=A0A7C9EXT8_OPUST
MTSCLMDLLISLYIGGIIINHWHGKSCLKLLLALQEGWTICIKVVTQEYCTLTLTPITSYWMKTFVQRFPILVLLSYVRRKGALYPYPELEELQDTLLLRYSSEVLVGSPRNQMSTVMECWS